MFRKLYLISMLLHDAATMTPRISSMTSNWPDAILFGWGVGGG